MGRFGKFFERVGAAVAGPKESIADLLAEADRKIQLYRSTDTVARRFADIDDMPTEPEYQNLLALRKRLADKITALESKPQTQGKSF